MDFRKRGTRLGLSLESREPEEQAGLSRTALWTGNKRHPSCVLTDLQSRHNSLMQEQGSLRLVSWGCPSPGLSPTLPGGEPTVSSPNGLKWWPGVPPTTGRFCRTLGLRPTVFYEILEEGRANGAEASSDVAHLGTGALDFEKTILDVN